MFKRKNLLFVIVIGFGALWIRVKSLLLQNNQQKMMMNTAGSAGEGEAGGDPAHLSERRRTQLAMSKRSSIIMHTT